MCKEFEVLMQNEFEMSMLGELTFFLGLQVKQSSEGIFINQSKYVHDLLKKYKMLESSPMRTPMAPGKKLNKDLNGPPVECKLYRGIIGSLLYLIASRPDIMFSTCICARYQANPKESHLSAVKRILRYLKKTPTHGLWYPLHSNIDLVAYTDSEYGGCQIDKKSTSGSCQFLGGKLTQLCDYGYSVNKIPILCDSKSAIAISANPIQHSKTKHIDIRNNFLKHHVEEDNALKFKKVWRVKDEDKSLNQQKHNNFADSILNNSALNNTVYILNDREDRGKFAVKADEA
ncbi:uncharacterized protein LOC112504761, partial [Cynara cardunculus var. scolymus]|uniref:uncharacterized protein LOC112504761 n=1 Tax=Cynara cardunculus var. scolymus TaxID=59895 RepID=UPI000D62E7AF